MSDDIIVKKIQDKIISGTRSNSKDIKISINEANDLIKYILSLVLEIKSLQKEIISSKDEVINIDIKPVL